MQNFNSSHVFIEQTDKTGSDEEETEKVFKKKNVGGGGKTVCVKKRQL